MKRLAVALCAVGVAVAGAWLLVFSMYLDAPIGGATTLTVGSGDTLRPVLRELADRGVLPHPTWLYYYARASDRTDVRTGEYDIVPEQTPAQLLHMLVAGRVKTDTFTVAEGLNRWQVRNQLVDERWLTREDFDSLCDDSAFLEQEKIPGPTCDGYLFPETYTFARGVPAKKILARMFEVYRKAFAAATRDGHGPQNLTERELVTLASIVEKETGAADERLRIACLFYNRLKAEPKWRLDTDPTVIYAATMIDEGFDGNLKAYHLRKMDHPYNTYKRFGLPPGPIASPGRAALAAVVKPITCADFFFVSMNNGRHFFCPTLACHERAVQKWQVDYFRRRKQP